MKYRKWIGVFLWMLLIFYFSHETGIASTETSHFFVEKVELIFGSLLPQTISQYVTLIVRKSAHVFLYLILGIFVTNACHPKNKYWVIAIMICMIYACTDEFHQLFIDGRTGQLQDVVIDSIGSLLGIYLTSMLLRTRKKIA